MARAHQNRKEESYQRSQEGNVLRVLPEHFFGNLDHPVHTSGSLQRSRAGYGRNDNVYYIRGRSSGLQAETEHKYSQADA